MLRWLVLAQNRVMASLILRVLLISPAECQVSNHNPVEQFSREAVGCFVSQEFFFTVNTITRFITANTFFLVPEVSAVGSRRMPRNGKFDACVMQSDRVVFYLLISRVCVHCQTGGSEFMMNKNIQLRTTNQNYTRVVSKFIVI